MLFFALTAHKSYLLNIAKLTESTQPRKILKDKKTQKDTTKKMQRGIWDPVKYIWWSLFANIVTGFEPLTNFAEWLHHRFETGFTSALIKEVEKLEIFNRRLVEWSYFWIWSWRKTKVFYESFFFFLSRFSFTNIYDSRDSMGEEGYLFNSSLPLPPASQALRH